MSTNSHTPPPPPPPKMEHQPPNLVIPNPNPNNNSKQLKPSRISIPISILVISLPLLYLSFARSPPSTLLGDTTFWFIISNTIIIIVAADSGVFSSDDTRDLYDREFVRRSVSSKSIRTKHELVGQAHAPMIVEKESSKEANCLVLELPLTSSATDERYDRSSFSEPQHAPVIIEKESSKEATCLGLEPQMSSATDDNESSKLRRYDRSSVSEPPHAPMIVEKESSKEARCLVSEPPLSSVTDENESSKQRRYDRSSEPPPSLIGKEESPSKASRSKGRRCDRSRSEVTVGRSHVAGGEKLLRRSATERRNWGAEESEYRSMSDEELNQRVEEFIRRFREIRLQEILRSE